MNEDMRTADKFMQAVNAMKRSLDTETLERDIDLEIAINHNVRRKLKMIRAMQELYTYQLRKTEKPRVLPSIAFDPFEGVDKTNIHYIFKSMRRVPPWQLRKDLLVVPTAMTLLMLEIAAKLFPCPQVFSLTLLIEEFVNRWTLPKFRPEWSDEELAEEIESYKKDMDDFEKRIKKSYSDLSIYFGSIENPEKDPTAKKITETHKHTEAIAKKAKTLSDKAEKISAKVDVAIYEASAHNPCLAPVKIDGVKALKKQMVEMAVDKYLAGSDLSIRSICSYLIEQFKGMKGAYDDLDAFSRRVQRECKKRHLE